MESLTAVFSSQAEMDSAIHLLKEQGVIDINMQSGDLAPAGGAESAIPSLSNDTSEPASGFMMQIVVESSRLRQAEDTIARYGGIAGQAGVQD
ncbi:hypothetical protein SAMN03159341_11341 [Paenibacillus sp. 1_12]|uniref:hypothetical protein n=1 Tax=Paenibacillus sp. 1_12 TaxID=1566278 RepID=UPI0008EC37C3|nr:hypothetical protein [Paenibacillus sp. 1_12]SFL97781.1 hypothetical protein SAMN03159341_11341 [Paenibacillus sp. 1_12]